MKIFFLVRKSEKGYQIKGEIEKETEAKNNEMHEIKSIKIIKYIIDSNKIQKVLYKNL